MRSCSGGIDFAQGGRFLIALATIIWVPIGVCRSACARRLPSKFSRSPSSSRHFLPTCCFPLVVYLIVQFQLIADNLAEPADDSGHAMVHPVQCHRWRQRRFRPTSREAPAICSHSAAGGGGAMSSCRESSPYFVTGAITASGGSWNASIVSEAVSWGPTKLNGLGLGAYIAQMTEAGDYPRIALGIAVMSVLVVATNCLLWRPA